MAERHERNVKLFVQADQSKREHIKQLCQQTSVQVLKMKTKNANKAQEKCDEWLSTRNKKKINKPIPMIKKHSAALRLVKSGSTSKLCKLTQNSPPPPQIFTNTKQSVLMSYFSSKPDINNAKDKSFNDLNEFDVDMPEDLTEQFGFLSQDENNEQEGHQDQDIPLSYSRETKNNTAKCQVKCDIDASYDDNDDCKMSDGMKFLSKCDKHDIKVCIQSHSDDSDIEFVSPSNPVQTRNLEDKNKTDTDSDIEFISQCPKYKRKYVDSLKSTGKLSIKEHKSIENIKIFSEGHRENSKSSNDTESDIEFISQCPNTVRKYVDPPKSVGKSANARHNVSGIKSKDGWKDKLKSDNSSDDIEFLSQCPELESKLLAADMSKNNQKKLPNAKQCQFLMISEEDSGCSDTEFYSQLPKVVLKVSDNTQKFSKDYATECRHSVDNVKDMKLKCNKDSKGHATNLDNCMKHGPEILSDGSEIEFISQSVLSNAKTSSKFCDNVDHFQNHTLNLTLNTEEPSKPYESRENDPCSSDTMQPSPIDSPEHYQANSPGELSLEYQSQTEQSPTEALLFESENEIGTEKVTEIKSYQNKGGNSLRHKSHLLQTFLPDTIKFTDTESDSCEELQQTTTQPHNYFKKTLNVDSENLTRENSKPTNAQLNQSKKKQLIDFYKPNGFDVS